ncbi:hypothetical protein pdul_cds_470 [Pandoravirus dulcis]|uniref:Uncharacterized protein n=1 Tax=Pandoravirus dulcis TaxID=1349409 RepID=S4VXD0_9VIRU|nr:hypothetical protein pdul_cds_470 [Pandoravirus dulcis]AGO82544.1 hypothetical protein pdul_cds_470 [Pandoravirus dulcis]
MTSAHSTATVADADEPVVAFVVLVDGGCAYALTRLMLAVKHSEALATVHPEGRIVFSGGRRQVFNDVHWWCSVRARHQGPPIRAPLSFVVNIGQLGRWFDTCSPISTRPDLVLRYPASPGRAEVGFESRKRGARHAATLVGISRVAIDRDATVFFADAAPSSGTINAALPSAAIAAPPSMRSQLLYASCRADWIFVYPEAIVVVDVTAAKGNANDDAVLWPSRWVMADHRESNDFMLFRQYGARTSDALALADVNGQAAGCGPRARRRRRRRAAGSDAYVRALLTLPAELRYGIVELLVRAWMPTVAATSCLADLTSWMSVHAPTGRLWGEFRRACRKVYAERAAAYTARRRIGPTLRLHKDDISSLHACSDVFRLSAITDSSDLWPEPRLSLWRPGACPVISVAGESHPNAGRDSYFYFYVAYTGKPA